MKLKFAALFPEHLDLNGDQANLKIALKRLEWFGHQAEVIPVFKGESLPDSVDFIFLGHGSMAAWADVEDGLRNLIGEIESRISAGTAFMAVATGYERAIGLGLLPGKITEIDRISKFEIAEIEGLEVLGYLNAATDAPVIQKNGLVLGTQLHGPVFAKNPAFVDAFLDEILREKGTSLAMGDAAQAAGLKDNVDLVADIVKSVWKLERELASE